MTHYSLLCAYPFLYEKRVHTPTWTIDTVITHHSLGLQCLLSQALQILDRHLQWSRHQRFMHVKIWHNGCKGCALVHVWMNLCTQNSGPEWITSSTKTTEQSCDDTHFVPSDFSLPDYVRPYSGQLKGDQITNSTFWACSLAWKYWKTNAYNQFCDVFCFCTSSTFSKYFDFVSSQWSCQMFIRFCPSWWATGKHGNAGTETGTETTKRCGEREPISWPYSRQESQITHEQAPHWVHSSIRKLIPGRHSRFVIVEPRVVVYRLSSSQVDGNWLLACLAEPDSHTKNGLGLEN